MWLCVSFLSVIITQKKYSTGLGKEGEKKKEWRRQTEGEKKKKLEMGFVSNVQ